MGRKQRKRRPEGFEPIPLFSRPSEKPGKVRHALRRLNKRAARRMRGQKRK